MGADVSRDEKDQQQDENKLDDYEQIFNDNDVIKQFPDRRFGISTLLKNKISGNKYVLREMNLPTQDDAQKLLQKFQDRVKLKHPNLIHVITNGLIDQQELCTAHYKVYMLYEYIQYTLEREIKDRVIRSQRFSTEELYRLISESVAVLAYLQNVGIQHLHLRPSTFFITENLQLKIADPDSFNQIRNYQQVYSYRANNTNIYLSPQCIESLQRGHAVSSSDPYKADVFTLGMNLLHAALLVACDICYDYSVPVLFGDILEQQLQTIRAIYPPLVTIPIEKMLQVSENQRPDFIQLDKYLNQSRRNDETLEHPSKNQSSQQQPETRRSAPRTPNINPASPENNSESSPNPQKLQDGKNYISKFTKPPIVSSPASMLQADIDDQGAYRSELPRQHSLPIPIPDVAGDNNLGSNAIKAQQQNKQLNLYTVIEEKSNGTQPPSIINKSQSEIQRLHSPDNSTLQYKPEYAYESIQNNRTDLQGIAVTGRKLDLQNTYQLSSNNREVDPIQKQYTYNANYSTIPQTNYKKQEIEDILARYKDPLPVISISARTDTYKRSEELEQMLQKYDQRHNNSAYKLTSTPPKKDTSFLKQYDYVNLKNDQTNFSANSNIKSQQKTENKQDSNNFQSFGGDISGKMLPLSAYETQKKEKIPIKQEIYQPPTYQYYADTHQINYYSSATKDTPTQDLQQNYRYKNVEPSAELAHQQQQQQSYARENGSTQKYNTLQQNYEIASLQSQKATESARETLQSDAKLYSGQTYNDRSSLPQLESFQQPQQSLGVAQAYAPPPVSTGNSKVVIEHYANGDRYEGEKLSDQKHGYGLFYYVDGSVYKGQWQQNNMHGKGILYYKNGDIAYEGEWQDCHFHGIGTLYNDVPERGNFEIDHKNLSQEVIGDKWLKYYGHFINDMKAGFGSWYFSNGDLFTGQFRNDQVDGSGSFFKHSTGQKIEGFWIDNIFTYSDV